MITWCSAAGKVRMPLLSSKGNEADRGQARYGITISRPLAGNPTRIFWYSQHADLLAMNASQKINGDTEFQQMWDRPPAIEAAAVSADI